MKLPTYEEIELLHRKHASNDEAFELVFTHCKIVSEIALQLLSRSDLSLNKDLIEAGSLLHDIGVYRLDESDFKGSGYITHGLLGEEILKEEGLPDELCRIASHHTGVGITREDIVQQNLPLPLQNYVAESAEELLVMYADKFHSKSSPPKFNRPETYCNYVSRYGDDKVLKFKEMQVKFGLPDLEDIPKRYGHPVI